MKSILLPAVFVAFVDWLLIRGTNKLFGSCHSRIKTVIGALLGGIHAILCLTPGFNFLNAGIWRMILLAAAGMIAFELDVRRTSLYCLANMGLGSLVMCLGKGSVVDILFTVLLICALCFIGFQGKPGRSRYIPVHIPMPNGILSATALADTGNSLRDPVTGQPALILSAELGSKLLGTDRMLFAHPASGIMKLPGARLLPYSTVGGNGLLLAKKFKNVQIGSKISDVLIAFSPSEIGKGKGFNALTGGNIYE